MDYFLFLIPPIAVVIVLTILLCRHSIARKCRISLVTPIATTVISAFAITFFWLWTNGGWNIFTSSYWEDQKGGYVSPELCFGSSVCICFLTALMIVLHYQKRNKRNKLPIA
jgi:hypothetical protein